MTGKASPGRPAPELTSKPMISIKVPLGSLIWWRAGFPGDTAVHKTRVNPRPRRNRAESASPTTPQLERRTRVGVFPPGANAAPAPRSSRRAAGAGPVTTWPMRTRGRKGQRAAAPCPSSTRKLSRGPTVCRARGRGGGQGRRLSKSHSKRAPIWTRGVRSAGSCGCRGQGGARSGYSGLGAEGTRVQLPTEGSESQGELVARCVRDGGAWCQQSVSAGAGVGGWG